MNKSGNFGMACQQALSFSAPLMRIPKSEAVFWPGCALMQLDPAILEKTLGVLRRAEPEIRLAAGCCGQPSHYLFPEKAPKRREKLAGLLKKQGVRRIYTACPNCTLQLGELEGFEILPIWPVLAAHITKDDIAAHGGSYIWHDPCPTRNDPAQQTAARKLLAVSGCDYTEPEHTGPKTRCCGNFHLLRASNPEKSAQIRHKCLSEFPGNRVILSNCEGCLDAFRSEGRDTCHLLELLFGRCQSRGWGNRIKTTRKAPIE
ncbi:MAG: (Fe-S)-binding protein [Oscillospiraceae bacterium]|nr:(Fe-S)-binding protein [Oscillospiraceae bacterium]